MQLRTVLIATFAALTLTLGGPATAHGAEWVIKEAPLSGAGISSETLSNSAGSFELAVPALSLTIKCSSESGGGEIFEGGSTGKVSFELSSCVVSKFEKTCTVKSPGKSTGVLAITATTDFFQTEVKEAEKAYEKLMPSGTIEISGAECALASKLEMSGATAAEVPKLEEEIAKRPQKFSKAIAEEAGVTSLKLGASQAFMTGEVKESLSGAHKEEAMGFTEVVIEPFSVIFTTLNARTGVVLRNIGPRKAKITNIEVESGGFVREDTSNCKGSTLNYIPPPDLPHECVFIVECTVLPTAGKLLVSWDVINDNGKKVGFTTRRPLASCGVA
jgi:hypothetical protein